MRVKREGSSRSRKDKMCVLGLRETLHMQNTSGFPMRSDHMFKSFFSGTLPIFSIHYIYSNNYFNPFVTGAKTFISNKVNRI